MRLVERYIFGQALLAFLAGLTTLTAVIWVTIALGQVDLLTTKGQTLLVFLALTGLSVPLISGIIAPIALFIGIVFTLNRLNADSELVVLDASGVSPGRLMRPFILLSVATAALTGYLSIWATPASLFETTNLLMKVRADFLTHFISGGTFAQLEPGFVFQYHDRAADGSLRGIFIEDRRDPQNVNVYLAREGETSTTDTQNFLILEDGMIQRQAKGKGDPAVVTFERYAIDLAQFQPAAASIIRKPNERSTAQLLAASDADPYVKANAGAFRAELSSRLAAPLYALALGMIGFACQHRSRTTRTARGAAVAAASVFALVLRAAGFWAGALAQSSPQALWLVYGLPVLSFLGALASVCGAYRFLQLRPWQRSAAGAGAPLEHGAA